MRTTPRRRPPGCCHLPTLTITVTPPAHTGWTGGDYTTLELEVCSCWLDDGSEGLTTYTLYEAPARDEAAVNEATRRMLSWVGDWARIGDPYAVDKFIESYEADRIAIFRMYTRPEREDEAQ